MGYLHFYSIRREETIVYDMKFSSPMGYLHFYSRYVRFGEIPPEESSRPLWGIYISIQECDLLAYVKVRSRPLWGIYISIPLLR